MSPGGWFSVAALCALGAASPGPSLAVVLRHTLTGSRARGVACALAHAAGVGLYALLTLLGLAAVMARHPDLYRAVATAGAAYLAWLGLRLLWRWPAEAESTAGAARGRMLAAARDGFAIALLNPKIAVFFLALFSQFIGPDPAAREVVILSATALSIDAIWYLTVVTVLSGARIRERLRRHAGTFGRLTGGVLLAVATWALTGQWA